MIDSNNNSRFLEQALVEEKVIDQGQLESAKAYAQKLNVDTIDALIQMGLTNNRQVALTMAKVCEIPFVELSDYEPCHANTTCIPRPMAEQYSLFPLFKTQGVLTVATYNPLDLGACDQIRRSLKCEIDAVVCDRDKIRSLITKAYSLTGSSADNLDISDTTSNETGNEAGGPVVEALKQILSDGLADNASDIHFNPDENEVHLRYRIDGVLRKKQGPPLSMHRGLVQRLKVMANLDLTQTRHPQDGKFVFRHEDISVDVRMSTLPTVWGENVVLRLLRGAKQIAEFVELGMPVKIADALDQAIRNPQGMILVTGPTGSGKTTTLYSALHKLNDPTRNVMTIEDPVEIRMPYIRQVQVNHSIGMSFAQALRSILRQDPDVVLVGEIRDQETATIANQAALTGHLVLSTLHTNDAVGAIARLRDYGLPAFAINTVVLGVMAQRLVRRVCPYCAQPAQPDPDIVRRIGLTNLTGNFMRGTGCNRCGQLGYRGRIGVYEYLAFNRQIKQAIEQGESTDRIRDLAMASGMKLMWHDGLEKAQQGQTTLEEVFKVAPLFDTIEVYPEAAAKAA